MNVTNTHQTARFRGVRIPHLRWIIAGTLFLAAVLNYIDRNLVGLLAPSIQGDLALSDTQYATVINLFLLAYGVSYLFSGRIVDTLGVRASMAIFIAWWSISSALTGLARSMGSLCAFRFMLGLGEAGLFTAAPKAVSEWFPASQRGVAIGIYSLGGALGATIAPILVALIAARYGWRWVFAMSPVLAGAWLVFWLWLYRRPAVHPRITDEERSLLDRSESRAAGAEEAPPGLWPAWKILLRSPLVWKLMLARLLTDPVWYFFQFWLPKYLHSSRGLPQEQFGIMWKIFLASDVGFLVGGVLSGWLIRRGMASPAARLRVMLLSACLVPVAALFIPLASGLGMVIGLGMIVAYAHTQWLTNLTALVIDLAPRSLLGTAFGMIASGSVLGGILMNSGTAWIISRGSYDLCFYAMAAVYPVAFVLLWSLRDRAVTAPA